MMDIIAATRVSECTRYCNLPLEVYSRPSWKTITTSVVFHNPDVGRYGEVLLVIRHFSAYLDYLQGALT